jgi:hypothetical protein
MSRLDTLPPDLSAVLSLLLRRGKRHAEVAQMLDIEERTVHDRAHAALALLAPGQARALTAEQREQLGEYLLGQQTAATQNRSRALLEESAAARAWAQAIAAELSSLAGGRLPQIPTGPQTAARAGGRHDAPPPSGPASPAPSEPRAQHEPAAASASRGTGTATPGPTGPSSSRLGGAIVLGAIAIVAIVVVVLVVGGGGGGGSHSGTQPSASTTSAGTHTSSKASTSTSSNAPASTGTTSTGSSATSHGKALTLTPPDTATSKAIGVAYVLTQKSERAFYVFAKGLPTPPSGAFYAVWLEGAATAPAYPLGSLPAANANGLVEGGGPLPTDAGSYRRIVVTTETTHHPTHPGPTALGGAFSLG